MGKVKKVTRTTTPNNTTTPTTPTFTLPTGMVTTPTKTTTVTPVPSTVKNPVGTVWGMGYHLSVTGGGLVPRGVLTKVLLGMGVNVNTTKTQVQVFNTWYNGGCVGTTPRSVNTPTGGWVPVHGTWVNPNP